MILYLNGKDIIFEDGNRTGFLVGKIHTSAGTMLSKVEAMFKDFDHSKHEEEYDKSYAEGYDRGRRETGGDYT